MRYKYDLIYLYFKNLYVTFRVNLNCFLEASLAPDINFVLFGMLCRLEHRALKIGNLSYVCTGSRMNLRTNSVCCDIYAFGVSNPTFPSELSCNKYFFIATDREEERKRADHKSWLSPYLIARVCQGPFK